MPTARKAGHESRPGATGAWADDACRGGHPAPGAVVLPEVPNPFFFPFDHKLKLGTERYSPRVLEKGARQASKAASFKEASDDLKALAEVSISATHLQRLSERVGNEWAQARDRETQAFGEDKPVG